MSIDTVKLVLDCTFVLVDERLLGVCKSQIYLKYLLSRHGQEWHFNSGRWKNREQYAVVLADLRAQDANERRVTSVQEH